MKKLNYLVEEEAIQLAEAASGRIGTWHFAGYHKNENGDECTAMILHDIINQDNEFLIYLYRKEFLYHDLDTSEAIAIKAIDLAIKLKELGYIDI